MSVDNPSIDFLVREFEVIQSGFNLTEKKSKFRELEAATTAPDFWNDQENARKVMQTMGELKDEIDDYEKVEASLATLTELSAADSLDAGFVSEIAGLEKTIRKLKLKFFLSGPYDKENAVVSIHAGQGGTEAMDWASMLYRMYLRYAEKRGWVTETVEFSAGEEAGIKSVTFKVSGTYAYGYLKNESGTHRLVRQSPFNADNLRQTSFALVGVLPEMENVELPDVQIKDEDLEWQFFHSSSQGGQNVQKVSTAVRVKHLPSGLIVTAQTERFQEQNRKIALGLLKSKLWALMQENKEKEVKQIKGEYRPASWGNQIRSYVLHPYKMVKDLRTSVEISNPEAVLNGEIDEFIDADLTIPCQ
jgi:peptide chain release factor 2